MKNNLKICVTLLLGAVLLVAGCKVAPKTGDGGADTQIPNPVVTVDDAAAFEEQLGFRLLPPKDAKDCAYSIISGKVAQISFTLDGAPYLLRASKETEGEALHGIYNAFEEEGESLCVDGTNYGVCFDVNRVAGENGAVWTWNDGDAHFSLWASDETASKAADSASYKAAMGIIDALYGNK